MEEHNRQNNKIKK